MRYSTPKRARRRRERRDLVERADPQVCERCHREPAVDPHELVRQSHGDTGNDLDMIVPVGRACHDWITTHPTLAHDEGWALWSYERDSPDAHRRAWLARVELGLYGRRADGER